MDLCIVLKIGPQMIWQNLDIIEVLSLDAESYPSWNWVKESVQDLPHSSVSFLSFFPFFFFWLEANLFNDMLFFLSDPPFTVHYGNPLHRNIFFANPLLLSSRDVNVLFVTLDQSWSRREILSPGVTTLKLRYPAGVVSHTGVTMVSMILVTTPTICILFEAFASTLSSCLPTSMKTIVATLA